MSCMHKRISRRHSVLTIRLGLPDWTTAAGAAASGVRRGKMSEMYFLVGASGGCHGCRCGVGACETDHAIAPVDTQSHKNRTSHD